MLSIRGLFDDLQAREVRYLDELVRRSGEALEVQLIDDSSRPATFPYEEREYVLSSLRFVTRVVRAAEATDNLPAIAKALLDRFPDPPTCPLDPPSDRKKVVVTGCYDWFHSGHVRFFEEVSQLGDLYVIIGHDQNVRRLKGEGHPLFSARQRCYMVNACGFVKLAVVSSGEGWMDAEPEILKLKPQIYAVNEDGDKPEKRAFCQRLGIGYRVLKRLPKKGLPRRESTTLRGF